jgi:hypothetical protein
LPEIEFSGDSSQASPRVLRQPPEPSRGVPTIQRGRAPIWTHGKGLGMVRSSSSGLDRGGLEPSSAGRSRTRDSSQSGRRGKLGKGRHLVSTSPCRLEIGVAPGFDRYCTQECYHLFLVAEESRDGGRKRPRLGRLVEGVAAEAGPELVAPWAAGLGTRDTFDNCYSEPAIGVVPNESTGRAWHLAPE